MTETRTGRTAATAGSAANEVYLVGRVTTVSPEERELPSGDRVRSLRVSVPRARSRGATGAGRTVVDAIDIACWTASTRSAAGKVSPGDTVIVSGALRRRFFRGPGGAQSRYEVEASRVRRIPPERSGP